MKIILLGPPGSGKGTVSERLVQDYNLIHISAGEILREEVQKQTTLGKEIKKYIESTIAFAKSQNIPLADAYHPSLDNTGNGKLTYINGGDHIHYSDAGRSLFSRIIADTILSNKLLE